MAHVKNPNVIANQHQCSQINSAGRRFAAEAGMVLIDIERALEPYDPMSYIPSEKDRIHPDTFALKKIFSCIRKAV
jgi:hypothetical protein